MRPAKSSGPADQHPRQPGGPKISPHVAEELTGIRPRRNVIGHCRQCKRNHRWQPRNQSMPAPGQSRQRLVSLFSAMVQGVADDRFRILEKVLVKHRMHVGRLLPDDPVQHLARPAGDPYGNRCGQTALLMSATVLTTATTSTWNCTPGWTPPARREDLRRRQASELRHPRSFA